MMLAEHDREQRKLALDPHRSFIIQAPAGSGKTELLIQRFLTLLIEVKHPEEILAITFTKKAANEMKNRVVAALESASQYEQHSSPHKKQTALLAKQVLERDQQFGWHLLENSNQLRIQTIDSFCSFLTRQLPIEAQFGAPPEIAIDPIPLYQEAVGAVLQHLENDYAWSQAIANLLLHLDNDLNKLESLIVDLLAKRDQWLAYLHLDMSNQQIREQLETTLVEIINQHLQKVVTLLPKMYHAQLMSIARYAADQLALTDACSPILACRDKMELPLPIAGELSQWQGLATLLLTKSNTFRKRIDESIGFTALTKFKNATDKALHSNYRESMTALLKALELNDELRLAFAEIFNLPDAQYQEDQWQILKSLLIVLKIVNEELKLTFKRYGQIDFIENTQAALMALGSDSKPTSLGAALSHPIRHILIDEFQDTSISQYRLLEKLVATWQDQPGHTLFVVGDPMQSIYRFREAEVGLFLRMCHAGIKNIKLNFLTLAVNFRSHAKIVDWNNTHFQKIFPTSNQISSGAICYSKSIEHQHTNESEVSEIKIHGIIAPSVNEQANKIVNLICDIQTQYPQDKIAILVRSRSHIKSIIPILKQHHIVYQAMEIDKLHTQQHIQDLLSLVRALLHPADRLAWLAILRAPWCGLSLADLHVIAKDKNELIYRQIISPEIQSLLSDDGKTRLFRILPILMNRMNDTSQDDFCTWIETTWLLLGGPACLKQKGELQHIESFFALLKKIDLNKHPFDSQKLNQEIDKLFASSMQIDAKLQIMTIHASKGLEFDTVILPHLEKRMPPDDKPILQWMEQSVLDDQMQLLLAPIHAVGDDKNAIYRYIEHCKKIKAEHEMARLFYVATTRAKKRLYLFFSQREQIKGRYQAESGSFLEKLSPFISEKNKDLILHTYIHAESDTASITEASVDEVAINTPLYRLQNTWQNPYQLHVNNHLILNNRKMHLSLDQQPRLIGIVTHKIIQQITLHSVLWWHEHAQPIDYVKQNLMQLGIDKNTLDYTIKIMIEGINRCFCDQRFQWIISKHQSAQSEYAISTYIQNEVKKLVIDRTFIDSDGTRWIIDYKTAALNNEQLEDFIQHEQNKYLEKMHLYAKAIQTSEKRRTRLGLYFPFIPAWQEWEA